MLGSEYLHKAHSISNLVYLFICPTKYCRIIFTDLVGEFFVQICMGMEEHYDWIESIDIRKDKNRVPFLIQSMPMQSLSEIIKMVKVLRLGEYLLSTWK